MGLSFTRYLQPAKNKKAGAPTPVNAPKYRLTTTPARECVNPPSGQCEFTIDEDGLPERKGSPVKVYTREKVVSLSSMPTGIQLNGM